MPAFWDVAQLAPQGPEIYPGVTLWFKWTRKVLDADYVHHQSRPHCSFGVR